MGDSSESTKSDEELLPVVPKNFWDSEIDEESLDSYVSEISNDERDLVCDETDSNEFVELNSESETKTFEQDDFKWSRDFSNVKGFKFCLNACIPQPGPSPKIKNANLKEPHDYVDQLLTPDLIQWIVECTNEYGRSKSADFEETNATEMKAFCAACAFLGLYRSVTIDYVYSNEAAEGFLAVSHAFSPQRFEELRCFIYFCKISQCREDNADKLAKIRFVFESLMKNFQDAFICYRNVSIDEVRPHVRNKTCSSYGIKVWALCDVESTYLYNGKMYHGEVGCKAEDDQAIRFALELIEPATNCGRTLFTRSFFTSPELAVKLLSKETFLTGTVRCKVKGIPREIHNEDEESSKCSSMPRSKFLWCENFPMTLVKFQEATKKCIPVYYLSSGHDSASASHPSSNKPDIILSFNRAKNCVDYAHMLAGYSTSSVPTRRWFQRIFYWLLDVTYLNAFILCNKMMPAATSMCGQQSRRSSFLKTASMTFLSEKITAQMACQDDSTQIIAYFKKLIPAVRAMDERSVNDKRVLIDFKRPIGFTPDPSSKYDQTSRPTSSNAASKVIMKNQQTSITFMNLTAPTTAQPARDFEKLRSFCKTKECWSKKRKTYLQCSSCELFICKQCLKNGDLSKKICKKCCKMLHV